MSRIHVRISSALAKCPRWPLWRKPGGEASRRFRMMDLQAVRDLPLGPGWFDSSWDLDQGLEVAVALPGDPSFQAWIDAQARALEPAPAVPAPVLPVEDMLEFEPVDWKAWTPAEADMAALPIPGPADASTHGIVTLALADDEMLQLDFEPALEPELALELELV